MVLPRASDIPSTKSLLRSYLPKPCNLVYPNITTIRVKPRFPPQKKNASLKTPHASLASVTLPPWQHPTTPAKQAPFRTALFQPPNRIICIHLSCHVAPRFPQTLIDSHCFTGNPEWDPYGMQKLAKPIFNLKWQPVVENEKKIWREIFWTKWKLAKWHFDQ